jgi:L-ascorbate metabolism protein UlaG (beta-lactamase superfamily)
MKITRRGVFLGLGAAGAVAGSMGYQVASTRYYDGPRSPRFDGERFFDARYGAPPKHLTQLLRWYRERNRAQWPDQVTNRFSDRPPRRVEGAAWRIASIGHASLLLQTAGLNVLIDPVWSERASPFSFAGPKRVTEPGIAFDALPPIDAVLVSHNHYDHLDGTTLKALATPHRPRIVTPLGNDVVIRGYDAALNPQAYDWDERVVLSRDVAVTLAPMRHWSARGLFDRNKALWAAFVIETPAGRILHIGDSGYGDGSLFRMLGERYGPFRLAILPVGAYEPRWFMRDQHMNPQEAVQAFLDCGAELALGHHFGTFQLTDEAYDAPLAALADARRTTGITAGRFRTFAPGEFWDL